MNMKKEISVKAGKIMEIEILISIQLLRTQVGDILMPLISDGYVIWFVLAAVLLIRKETRKAGVIVIAAMVIDYTFCNLLLKNLIQRTRPCDVNTAITLLVSRPTDYSFPSGHTALSFAALTGIWLTGTFRKWRIPLLIFACLIAFSRMYLYLHYPTDILGGIAVGVFCGWLSYQIFQRVKLPHRLPARRAQRDS